MSSQQTTMRPREGPKAGGGKMEILDSGALEVWHEVLVVTLILGAHVSVPIPTAKADRPQT